MVEPRRPGLIPRDYNLAIAKSDILRVEHRQFAAEAAFARVLRQAVETVEKAGYNIYAVDAERQVLPAAAGGIGS